MILSFIPHLNREARNGESLNIQRDNYTYTKIAKIIICTKNMASVSLCYIYIFLLRPVILSDFTSCFCPQSQCLFFVVLSNFGSSFPPLFSSLADHCCHFHPLFDFLLFHFLNVDSPLSSNTMRTLLLISSVKDIRLFCSFNRPDSLTAQTCCFEDES